MLSISKEDTHLCIYLQYVHFSVTIHWFLIIPSKYVVHFIHALFMNLLLIWNPFVSLPHNTTDDEFSIYFYGFNGSLFWTLAHTLEERPTLVWWLKGPLDNSTPHTEHWQQL